MMKLTILAILLFGCLWVNIKADTDFAYTVTRGLKWVSTYGNNIIDGAVEGGYRNNNDILYVARVLAPDGKYHPAKACGECTSGAYYNYNNKETPSKNYDLLAYAESGMVQWVESTAENAFDFAVQGEQDEFFICRAYNDEHKELVVGEYNVADGICTIVTGGKAYKYSEFDLLNEIHLLLG